MPSSKIDFELSEEKFKNSSKYLELIINNAPLIYFILDNEGTFLVSRGKALEDMGLKQDQIVGSNAFELYKEFEEMIIAIKKALLGESSFHSSYVPETDRYYRTKIIPIEQEDGKTYVLGISTDETPTMRVQNELINREKELAELKKLELISKLSSGLAHEFNNLLQSIMGITNLIDLQLPPELQEIKELINMLNRVVDKGRDITTELLNITNSHLFDKETIDINKELLDYKIYASAMIKNKKIDLNFDLCSDPLIVEGNKKQFKLIFSNLISNSFDAIQKEGVITVKTIVTDSKAQLIFSDDGDGIDDANSIFDLFFTTKKKGLGIGLATVKAIINQYDGTINVYQESKGVSFIIKFPLYKEQVIPNLQIHQLNQTSVENILVDKTIIVIDDDSFILQTIEKFFSDISCTVFTFSSALEAMHYCHDIQKRNLETDLIISDILIPNFSGLDLLKNLNEDEFFNNTNFLLISGYAKEFYDESSSILSEKVKFLTKPFNKEQMMTKIKEFRFN